LKENNLINFLIWPLITSGIAPLDNFFALKKTLINEGLEISFGALTWSPPISGSGDDLQLLFFSLGGPSLVAGHPCGHEVLRSHVLGGYNKRGGGARLLGRRMNRATTSHTENELDLTLEVAAAARQRKMKGSSSKKHK
jgi:hypothetical protein